MFAALVKRILLSSVTSLFSGANTRSAESSLQDVSVDRSSKETTIIEDNLLFTLSAISTLWSQKGMMSAIFVFLILLLLG